MARTDAAVVGAAPFFLGLRIFEPFAVKSQVLGPIISFIIRPINILKASMLVTLFF